MQSPPSLGGGRFAVNKTVFIASAVSSLILILFTIVFPKASEALLGNALGWISNHFGWYYMLMVAAYGIFSLFIGISRYGDIKLGQDQDKPAFPFLAWAAMLFSAGIGIDLLFFGVSEPLAHYLTPVIAADTPPEAARAAIVQTFLHWGLHGWGIYALIGMTLAYFAYRKNMPLSLRSGLVPLFGRQRVNGWLGNTVDIFGVVCTLLGIATSLGIGVLQANAGLSHVFGIDSSKAIQAAIILAVTVAAGLSAMSGVDKGVRRLSEINMLAATGLLIALLIMGPTIFLFNGLVDNIGSYFQNVVQKTFQTYAYEGSKAEEWKAAWTIFFWAWWVAWAPFVGLFIARISRGRTLREFVFGVMFIPLGFIFAWFSIFGNSAIHLVDTGNAAKLAEVAIAEPAMGMFLLFEHYPLSGLWSTLGVIIGLIFFVTSADSGALVLANLNSRNLDSGSDAPVWLRLFWAAATGLVTLGLLFAGGFSSLQSVSVAAGLPFSLILFAYMISMWISLKQEGNKRKAAQTDRALVLDNGRNWRNRLSRLMSFPDFQTAKQFAETTLAEAMADVAMELNSQNADVELTTDDGGTTHQIAVRLPEQKDFIYRVQLIEAVKPIFALSQAGNMAPDSEHEKYYRAEVFLIEGSQDYDLVGYTKEQIIIDILNQYERHIHFLHLDR